DAAQFKLPGSSDFLSKLEMYDSVSIQMSSFSFNPFLGESNENITSTVASLSLRSKTGEIHLENLTESIQILLPQINYDNSSWRINTSGNPVTSQFNITDSNSTVILAVEPNKNITIQVLLSSGYLPNATNYDYSKFLHWEPSVVLCNSTQVGYRWLLTPELLSVGSGNWHVLITPFNLSNGESVTLRVLIFTSTTYCAYWFSFQLLRNRGCQEQVGLLSQPWLTECLCNHLTFFGSSFFVLPNQVDLSRTAEYFATVTKNPVVVILLSVFFGLYLITVIWAWNADKKALKKRKLTVLDDNHPCAQYYYMLKVETGHRSGAGTSAKVQATLLGSEDQSEPHHLNDPDKPVFERGGVDLFLLSTAFSLGELQNIRLWHDNTGGHPSWYVDKVVVQDVQTRQCWHFLCSTWLSSSKGDRMTDRTFNPAKKNEITSFSNIFQSKATIGFRDEHIWISILDPPKRSPFTRVQRVSCCMCLLLCTMAINIIFFNLPADSSSPVLISIGSVKITWQEIMIGIESGLLMFPINILIITIFRNIRPRQSRDKEKDREESSTESPAAATLNTLLEDAEELVTTLSKNKKNNVAALEKRMESWEDLCSALECVNGVIQRMQGVAQISRFLLFLSCKLSFAKFCLTAEAPSLLSSADGSSTDLHWTVCSQFVLCSLHCLAETLGKVGVKAFPSPVERSSSPAPKKKTSSGCWLPWWFVFVGWFLLISISGISTFFTLLYGFFYGKDSSIKWVMSLALSLFQSIFILQPLKVVGLAIFFALILKPVEQVD
uniref:PLAT domain-containing protein n=1 Tax=Lepisosteus oculatus TaxID=7918 RepID=W5MAE3_LEPOC